MRTYLKNWDLMRIIRLALGIIILIQGIQTQNKMFIVLGGLFALMPLLNMGCCGTAVCNTRVPKTEKQTEDVIYEEIK
ncbi:MAG: hypothetical protein QM727_11720 [Niabella sp.]